MIDVVSMLSYLVGNEEYLVPSLSHDTKQNITPG